MNLTPELSDRLIKIEVKAQEIERKVDDVRSILTDLRAQWDGGPGQWPVCKHSEQRQIDFEARMRVAEIRMNMALGVVALVSFLGAVLAIWKTMR